MKRLFLALALLAPLAAFGAAGINFTNTVPNLLVRTNATVRSGLPDSVANTALIVDTTVPWTVQGVFSTNQPFPLVVRSAGTNVFFVTPSGGAGIGRGAIDYVGASPFENALILEHDISLNETPGMYISMESRDGLGYNYWGLADIYTEANDTEPQSFIHLATTGTNAAQIANAWVGVMDGGSRPQLKLGGLNQGDTAGVHLDPVAADDGTTPFTFNAQISKTSSNLVEVANNGTNKFTIDFAGNVSAAGQMGFTGFTTANLPAGVAVGYQTYCTDCLTPWGTGDRVEWDGGVWRTLRSRITATTNYQAYFLGCLSAAVSANTTLSEIAFGPMALNGSSGVTIPSVIGQTGTGATTSTPTTTTNGIFASFLTGSTSSGGIRIWGPFYPALSAGEWYACGGSFYVSAIPDGSDNYWVVVGQDSGAGLSLPTGGAYFLYDRYNAAARVGPGSETNNWLCVTARGSSYTYADSGLTPSTSNTAPDRLAVFATSSACYFYTNGVLSQTLNTAGTLPNTTMYVPKVMILKTLGGNSRTLGAANTWFNIRRASPRAY